MKNYFTPIIAFTKANLLRFFRDKIYIFFMFILPIMFLLIFGMIYGNNFTSFNVAIFDHSKTPLSEQIIGAITEEDGILNTQDISDLSTAEEQLIRGEIDAIITFPENFGTPSEQGLPSGQVHITYGKNSEQVGQAVSALLDAVVTEFNIHISGQKPSLTVASEPLDRTGLTNFDYVFAGLLGYTILTIGLMGIANILPGDKESGATKRLRATTVSTSQLVLSYALTFLMLGVLILFIMVLLGLIVFDFQMRGSWLNFAIFSTISTTMMLGFGLAIGGWAKNEAQASALANLVMFPMMFLSGVFFPKFLMPDFVQNIMSFIPLTPIVDGIRLIITENYSLIGVLPQIGVIAVWCVAIYAIAIKTFRWE
jgi:ABC-type multidrug transport system, permease component